MSEEWLFDITEPTRRITYSALSSLVVRLAQPMRRTWSYDPKIKTVLRCRIPRAIHLKGRWREAILGFHHTGYFGIDGLGEGDRTFIPFHIGGGPVGDVPNGDSTELALRTVREWLHRLKMPVDTARVQAFEAFRSEVAMLCLGVVAAQPINWTSFRLSLHSDGRHWLSVYRDGGLLPLEYATSREPDARLLMSPALTAELDRHARPMCVYHALILPPDDLPYLMIGPLFDLDVPNDNNIIAQIKAVAMLKTLGLTPPLLSPVPATTE